MSTPTLDAEELNKIMETIDFLSPVEHKLRKMQCANAHVSGNLIYPPVTSKILNRLRRKYFPMTYPSAYFTEVVRRLIKSDEFIGPECTPQHYINKAWEHSKVLNFFDFEADRGKNKRVLNVGGGGTLINVFLADLGYNVTSVDNCERDSSLIKGEIKTARTLDLDLHPVNCDFLTYEPNQKFDYVFSICVIEHLPERAMQERFVQNMVDCLNPGGKFLLTFGFGPKATTNPYKDDKDVEEFIYENIKGLKILEPFKFSGKWTISEGHTWGFVAAQRPE